MTTENSISSIIYMAVKPIFRIYLIIGMGIFLSRKNILTIETTRNISYLVVTVLFPALTFGKIVTNIDNSYIAQIGTIAITSVMILLGQGLLTFAVGVVAGCPRLWWGGLFMCGLLPNISDIPISYIQGLEDGVFDNVDLGVSYIIVFSAFESFLMFNCGAFRLPGIDFDYEKKMKEKNLENQTSKDGREVSGISDGKESNEEEQSINSLASNGDDDLGSRGVLPLVDSLSVLSSGNGNHLSRQPTAMGVALSRKASAVGSVYQNDYRDQPTETMDDLIQVYSRARHNSIHSNRIGRPSTHSFKPTDEGEENDDNKPLFRSFIDTFVSNTLKPASLVTIISIAVCMVPWLKALFVDTNQAHLSAAPDNKPPLSFILDFASYLGQAQVPLGLLLLGGTIGRLSVRDLPDGLWKTPVAVTIFRLFVFPIIGCALNSKLKDEGLFYGDNILNFVCHIDYCLPPATALLFFTAIYAPVDSKQSIQMNILALVYIAHYTCLVVCLPFTTTYTIKVALGF